MRSLRQKLLLLILPLCLVPLVGISYFSYYQAKQRITEDRIVLYIEQIAQGVADTIRLTLLEKREETLTMGLFFRDYLSGESQSDPQELLNSLVLIHEVYDVIVLFDIEGRVVALNSVDRRSFEQLIQLDSERLSGFHGRRLVELTPEATWLQQVRSGRFGYIDWHQSPIVHALYDYSHRDIASSYSIGFATPVTDRRGVVVGGILSLMNWEYIQEILDNLEDDLEERSLPSGYGFIFGGDGDTILAHKYRLNRDYQQGTVPQLDLIRNNYGTSLVRDHHLENLHEAVKAMLEDPLREPVSHISYEYPPGVPKISGLVLIGHEYLRWVCGVGINEADIFAPVQDLKEVLIWAVLFSSGLVVVLTFWAARQLSIPLRILTGGAKTIAEGNLSMRVSVASKDEIGQLARSFNQMAESLEERNRALVELNRELEQKVEERTKELKESHQDLEGAYEELKEAQVQLVQSEKLASLGQLVAGIAHEIKNPLNFIYGNTDFLRQYIANLKELIRIYEKTNDSDPAAAQLKESMNYSFVVSDLETLIDNFEEGAERIHSIISDLRAFSRLDSDDFGQADIHEPIELALNLVRHEYRDRVRIHREFSELPKVRCHAGKLSHVFMNLFTNACQAIPEDGDIWVRTKLRDNKVVVEVEDNGTGISEDHIHKVFEPFFTTKPVGEGTGLGLSISYGIIKQHNGRIRVESKVGEGALFTIELPVRK